MIGGPFVSHAHNFCSSITEAAIAKALANAMNGLDGYSTTYTEDETHFTVIADSPLGGKEIAVRMNEYKATINYAHTEVIDKSYK